LGTGYWVLGIGVDPVALIAAGSRSHRLILPLVKGIENKSRFYSILTTFAPSAALLLPPSSSYELWAMSFLLQTLGQNLLISAFQIPHHHHPIPITQDPMPYALCLIFPPSAFQLPAGA
jgi:hypothetical protein